MCIFAFLFYIQHIRAIKNIQKQLNNRLCTWSCLIQHNKKYIHETKPVDKWTTHKHIKAPKTTKYTDITEQEL